MPTLTGFLLIVHGKLPGFDFDVSFRVDQSERIACSRRRGRLFGTGPGRPAGRTFPVQPLRRAKKSLDKSYRTAALSCSL
jgi:hypothetical protein